MRAGHPWVYEASVQQQNRPGKPGELAVIYDRSDKFLALGLYDPHSPIRARILHVGTPQQADEAWWNARLETALTKRDGLFAADTNGYRLINGESDGWPGLVLDRYADTCVLKLYTAAWLPWLPLLTARLQTRRESARQTAPARLVLRLSRNMQPQAAEQGIVEGQVLFGPPLDGPVIFQESGIRFEADVLQGQKTGFFLDQRENRREVELLSAGRTVLNAFSFSGGFSLYAARGGASAVTDVDISVHALKSCERNFELNRGDPRIAHCRHEVVQADVFQWLAKAGPRSYDLVILDPPSLAKRESERPGAIRSYESLVRDGLNLVRPGGVLLAASCSAHVSAEEFFRLARQVIGRSGRKAREVKTTRHAADHKATFPEAEYLKAIYFAVEK